MEEGLGASSTMYLVSPELDTRRVYDAGEVLCGVREPYPYDNSFLYVNSYLKLPPICVIIPRNFMFYISIRTRISALSTLFSLILVGTARYVDKLCDFFDTRLHHGFSNDRLSRYAFFFGVAGVSNRRRVTSNFVCGFTGTLRVACTESKL